MTPEPPITNTFGDEDARYRIVIEALPEAEANDCRVFDVEILEAKIAKMQEQLEELKASPLKTKIVVAVRVPNDCYDRDTHCLRYLGERIKLRTLP